jgi:maleylacetate reductase
MSTDSFVNSELDFRYQPTASTVRFARNSLASLPEVLVAAGLQRPLVVCSPEQVELGQRVVTLLGDDCRGLHAEAVMHVPAETVAKAVTRTRLDSAESLVAVGGGSATGLAKAVALDSALPILAIPTTFAGSEMTSIWGMTDNGNKQTGRSPNVRPVAVLYDPALTDGLPRRMAVASGVNALAHAAEALWAPDRSPVIRLFALEGVGAMTAALREIADGTDTLGDRDRALYGAWLCGTCLGATTMGIHHGLCHALGGTLDLPHAETHTVVLPVILQLSREREPRAMADLADALSITAAEVPAAIRNIASSAGLPTSLRELGVQESDLERLRDNVHLSPAAAAKWSSTDVMQALALAMHGL